MNKELVLELIRKKAELEEDLEYYSERMQECTSNRVVERERTYNANIQFFQKLALRCLIYQEKMPIDLIIMEESIHLSYFEEQYELNKLRAYLQKQQLTYQYKIEALDKKLHTTIDCPEISLHDYNVRSNRIVVGMLKKHKLL